MAQIIKPKRRHTSGAPTTSDLVEGEIAVNTHDYSIYVRDDANNILRVGGVQTPMLEDLDTDQYEIISTKPSSTDFIGTPYVKLGSPMKLLQTSDPDALVTVDVADVEVGYVYKVKYNDGSFDWRTMGAPTSSVSPGGSFLVTAQGPSGTASTMWSDDRWDGLMVYDTSIAGGEKVSLYRNGIWIQLH